MAKVYAHTDFSVKNSLSLEIGGVAYPIAQFTASFAKNEIPQAQVTLAVGRDAQSRNAATPSKVHTDFDWSSMQAAKVYFNPKGEVTPDGKSWPKDRQVIFDGYFIGFASRKIRGKVHVVANLVHWLLDIACSSALTRNGHVANPTQLNAAAVLNSTNTSGAALGSYIGIHVAAQLASNNIPKDLNVAIKEILCYLASVETQNTGPTGQCGGTGDAKANTRALKALSRVEGPASTCNLAYKYGVPLSLIDAPSSIHEGISHSLGTETIESFASVSFWDKLVGNYCPMFGLAVVPMIDSALIIADTPGYNANHWKQIVVNDHDAFDASAMLDRPLRAVGVVVNWESQTQAGVNEIGEGMPLIGGCYVENSVSEDDGITLYVQPTAWLRMSHSVGGYIAGTSNVLADSPSRAVGADVKGETPTAPTAETLGNAVNTMYERYAHEVFVHNMLRGRSGEFSGRLRFDIAPGSILKITTSREGFIADDRLAMEFYACVSRVTVTINAEGSTAGTAFALTHVRTAKENTKPRTSVPDHPLFKNSIHGGGKHGSPLLAALDL